MSSTIVKWLKVELLIYFVEIDSRKHWPPGVKYGHRSWTLTCVHIAVAGHWVRLTNGDWVSTSGFDSGRSHSGRGRGVSNEAPNAGCGFQSGSSGVRRGTTIGKALQLGGGRRQGEQVIVRTIAWGATRLSYNRLINWRL